MSLNKFQFIGNLTRDIEIRHKNNESTLGIFDLAVNDTWRDSEGERQEKVNFYRVKVWGKTAENAEKYLGKGSQVYVEGRINNTKYEKDGETIYGTEFIANQIQFLATKPPASAAASTADGATGVSDEDMDDIQY